MKKRIVLLMTVGVMALTGCGVAGAASEKTNGSSEETVRGVGAEADIETGEEPGTVTGTATGSAEEEIALGEANDGSGESPVGGNTVNEPEEELYTWQEYTITLPEEWVGRCVIEEHETGFLIYQKASHEIDDTLGFICSFYHTQEPVEYGIGETLIAYTEEGELYYMAQPMDVACDTEDENILGEYIRMCQQVPLLKASLQIAASDIHGCADEYMFPTSSILALDQEMLADFSDNSLWIGRNEIYARHGRQFDNVYLQQYFDRCTWYKGEIPAQEFQESVLNQTEKDNLKLLQAAEKEYDRQHPYPKMYQASEVAVEDLNGDGAADEIGYRVMEQETGEVLCEITVNGETYIANELFTPELDFVMTNPMLDCFYITDILEGDGALEIAVLDEGPSEDWVTHFYQYDGTLYY
ncbi:MAG: YARHG domain-containing protein, partial [Acetatifactor sp.]|nr:YARHG domain-containing protein [Acetatifactor sp.]